MPTLWIIHRDAGGRGALARLAGAGEDTVLGAPTDNLFESAGSPDIVILGLVGDFEAELEFVHRVGSRLNNCGWILVPEGAAADEAVRLFDTLPAEVMPFPPSPLALRRAVHSALQRRPVDSLSQRRARDELAARFAHWFADLELPDLLRALDPQLDGVPLLVRGEPGTGRTLVARYVHAFAGRHGFTGGRLIQVACDVGSTADDLIDQIQGDASESDTPWSLWLEDVDRLPPSVQRRLQSWIEFGLPDDLAGAPIRRWMASAGDGSSLDRDLDPRLAQALAGVAVRIPPLRRRTHAIPGMITDIGSRWSKHHGLPVRHFARDAVEQLSQHPWPGNVRELEAVVTRTLASTSTEPIAATHLRFDELEPLRAPAPSSTSNNRTKADREEPLPRPEPPQAQPDSPAPEPLVELLSLADEPVIDLTPEDEVSPSEAIDDAALRRLVGAVAHEVRNPLTSIRTFAELLPERFEDAEFRERFAELVGADVRRIEQVVNQLEELSGSAEAASERKRVDVASLLEQLLDERREIIRGRNLLVLRELDRNQPYALGDPQQLQSAFRTIIEKTLDLVPERGDVYVASRHHGPARGGEASLRILVRYHGGGHAATAVPGISTADAALDFAVAEAIIRSQDGALTLDTTDASETVLVIDLPAPPAG